jgi:DNA sulfur modification protein DndC
MAAVSFQEIKAQLRDLYVQDERPWLVGFSGGKDSMVVASLVFDAVLSVPSGQRKKPVAILCTDTRVEIPAVAEGVESALERMRRCSQQHNLNIEAQLLKPPPEQSFWVNIIGRGYPPPNRVFRWCTQRLKIDPVTAFVNQRLGHWGEAILHLGARLGESSTRAQPMAGREVSNGLCRHPDLPRVWVSNPIQFLTTEEVWAYLLQKPNPWGGDNRPLYKLYASASNGECPIQIDTSTPSCGNSRFGCWTCTVVERDKASECLLASGDERMEAPVVSDWKETNRLRELQEQIAAEKGIRADTLRRLLAKVDEYSESHRALGLPNELLHILTDDLQEHEVGESATCQAKT